MQTNRREILLGLSALCAPGVARAQATDFPTLVALGAEARCRKPELYDPAYRVIAYPMGDVPDDRGVCADTVIRAFRAGGADLQALIHRDMKAAFAAYPQIWGLKHPDTNIDHRRVPNLETFFTRAGAKQPANTDPTLYLPGDVVSWRIPVPHIGVVSTQRTPSDRPLMAHNIGAGSQLEDVLFAWPIQGWFRYRPA
ncbi:MAG TPA: DUF1287 domain-containing protein [Caulobacterales bacterium]|nr:DUF1287 domain-containing protein [Caulobacterales bacterium]